MTIIQPLFLSDIAGSEILLIMVFVLIFFGSKSIPSIAKTLGKAMKEVRHASAEVQNEIKKSGLDIKKDLNLKEIIKDTEEEISQPLDQVMTDVENSINYTPNKKTFEETDHTQTSKKDKNG
tara:strand:- start:594 stop:959 length:366 start_codon:yes stop_codon:yes gene_type:complete